MKIECIELPSRLAMFVDLTLNKKYDVLDIKYLNKGEPTERRWFTIIDDCGSEWHYEDIYFRVIGEIENQKSDTNSMSEGIERVVKEENLKNGL